MPNVMTETELQAFALAVAKLAFVGGIVGALCFSLAVRVIARLGDAIQFWEDKRIRIGSARARADVRHINGGRIG